MAKLVTSDGVQINLFLDLNSHNTGEGTLLYGPKSQAEMDFIVKGFRNFKTNTEYNDKNRLVFYCDFEFEVNISTLMSANPTSSSQYTVPNYSNTKLYFVGDDLVLSKTGAKIHRIDLFTSASSNNVLTVNGNSPDASGNVTVSTGSSFDGDYNSLSNKPSLFDGNYNSLSNKPTIPTDLNDLSDSDGLLSSGGGSVETLTETLFLNRDLAKFENSFQGGSYFAYAKSGFDGDVEQYGGTYTGKEVVSGFENFKTTHNDKHKLIFYTSNGTTEVLISDLMNIDPHQHPTNTNQWLETTLFLKYDDDGGRDDILTLFFDGDDLVLVQANWGNTTSHNRNFRVYRIDLQSFATAPLDVYTKSETYTKSEVDSLTSSSGGSGGGFTNQKVFTTSGSWIVPAGVDKVKISVTGAGKNSSGSQGSGGGAGGSAIGIYSVSAGDQLNITVGAINNASNATSGASQVSITGRTGSIKGNGAGHVVYGGVYHYYGGGSSNNLTDGLIGDVLLISGGRSTSHTQTTGAASIYGAGTAFGGGGSSGGGTAGQGVVVLEY